jgi:hypothetical protein
MNIARHMEAIFVAALAFAGPASYRGENLPQAQAPAAAPVASSATPEAMPVVTVTAKRMSAAEKAASLRAEKSA